MERPGYLGQPAQYFEAGQPRHRDVQQQDVRLEIFGQFQRFVPGCLLANHVESPFGFKQFTDTVAEDGMVVSYEYSYFRL